MKKLMIAVAIVCAAVMAQAATAKWSISKVADSPSKTAATGWLVCVYEGLAEDFSYEDALAGTLVAANTGTTANNKGTIYAANTTGFGNYEAGSTHSFYAVVFDASTIAGANNYIVSADNEKKFASTGASCNFAYGDMTSTATTNLFRDSEWQSVPEPTSALLMLLGVAGLALRRKQK